jgi:hypothetical protein
VNQNWARAEPFRVVTIVSLFSPGTANAYGLDTFDGVTNGFSIRRALYFQLAVIKEPHRLTNAAVYQWIKMDPEATTLSQVVNIGALRAANVGYVLSDRLLTDGSLRLSSAVPAPASGVIESRIGQWAPHAGYFTYELARAWPRVYVPRSFRISAAALDDPAFYRELVDSSEVPVALVSSSDAPMLGDETPSIEGYTLTNYRLVRGGFDVEIKFDDRARGTLGIVVVNVPYSRFWAASSAGHALRIVAVNGVQTGILLTANDRIIEIRYKRPTVSTALADVLHISR